MLVKMSINKLCFSVPYPWLHVKSNIPCTTISIWTAWTYLMWRNFAGQKLFSRKNSDSVYTRVASGMGQWHLLLLLLLSVDSLVLTKVEGLFQKYCFCLGVMRITRYTHASHGQTEDCAIKLINRTYLLNGTVFFVKQVKVICIGLYWEQYPTYAGTVPPD